MKRLVIVFEDEDFKKLRNAKEASKILGDCDNWEDFLLKLANVRSK